jgi:HK97 family phage prohead protease
MELRSVDMSARELLGQVQVYDEVSYLTPSGPAGERIKRGCFAKSITERGTRIPLCRNHNHERAYGMSKRWVDGPENLEAVFGVRANAEGDQLLEDANDGYLPALSVGFVPVIAKRAPDGVLEVREAKLMEVSVLLIGAYEGSRVLAVRSAQSVEDLLAPFRNPPHVDLSPVARWW